MSDSAMHITCITTSRADYGLMKWPMLALQARSDVRLSVIVGGGHVAKSQGMTVSEVLSDGFDVAEQIPMYLDTIAGAAQGAGIATMGVAQALNRLKPDWVLLLGDRFEVLGAASASLLCNVPICHLCGGDITKGANDDAIRHAVSKMAHLHCPSNEKAAQRLRQMGEEPWRVHVTGSPGLDAIHVVQQLERVEVCKRLEIPDNQPYFLVTMHPETLMPDFGVKQLDALLTVLAEEQDVSIVFTGVNADNGSQAYDQKIRDFVANKDNAVMHLSLGQMLYINSIKHSAAVLGNSSSGLYEAPSFDVGTLNIGNRQDGRLRAESVFDCEGTVKSIKEGLEMAMAFHGKQVVNPYGDGHSAERILNAIQQASSEREKIEILKKEFIELNHGDLL